MNKNLNLKRLYFEGKAFYLNIYFIKFDERNILFYNNIIKDSFTKFDSNSMNLLCI